MTELDVEPNSTVDFAIDKVVVRTGGAADVGILLELLDDAVRRLSDNGLTGQWGTRPFSTDPGGVAQATTWATEDTLFIAWYGDTPIGALAAGSPPPFVPPPTEPELYLTLQVVLEAYRGHNVSALLVDQAKQLARSRGIKVMRADCYAGEGAGVVRHCERLGFEPTDTFTVDTPSGPWPGQVITMRVDD